MYTNQLSLSLCVPFVLMATCRASDDALHTSLLGSPPLSSNAGSPHGSGHDLDGLDIRSRGTLDEKLDALRGLPDQIMEGQQGWVTQGVLSRASFRRSAVSGQKLFTVLSLHISNIYATKKGIAKKIIQTLRAVMISQEVDLVAGDFFGTAWRCRSRDNLSTIDA